jgi:NADPH-dependent glutamate synthase beta subunit-like oxidoreductase
MALFKPVKKPLIRQQASQGPGASALRPRYAPKAPPCSTACPIGCDVRGWINAIGEGEADGRTPEQSWEMAWKKITAHNPFPAVTGRLCDHPCEAACHRGLREDGAVAVRELERFVGDYGAAQGLRFARPKPLAATVAVVGAGPAGLAAAYHLARRGYRVTVFDPAAVPGGAMRAAGEIVDAEIGRIVDLGVELRCNAAGPAEACDHVLPTGSLEDDSLATAISHGAVAADALDARVRGAAVTKAAPRPPAGQERIRLDWYPAAPRLEASGSPAPEQIVAEARRCMSCGTCMACGNCWMYCGHGGFEKLPAGRRYRLKLDLCDGCGKCAEACPAGYIDMA